MKEQKGLAQLLLSLEAVAKLTSASLGTGKCQKQPNRVPGSSPVEVG